MTYGCKFRLYIRMRHRGYGMLDDDDLLINKKNYLHIKINNQSDA